MVSLFLPFLSSSWWRQLCQACSSDFLADLKLSSRTFSSLIILGFFLLPQGSAMNRARRLGSEKVTLYLI